MPGMKSRFDFLNCGSVHNSVLTSFITVFTNITDKNSRRKVAAVTHNMLHKNTRSYCEMREEQAASNEVVIISS